MDENIYPEQLALFETPSRDLTVQRTQYVEYRPISQLNSGPLQFHIPATANQYLDLSRSRLRLKVLLQKGDGTAIGDSNLVAPANFALHSLFSQVEVQAQQQLVSSTAGQLYPYKAYIQALLSRNRESSESFLQMAAFYKDRAGFMDAMANEPRGNTGWVARYMVFHAAGGMVDLEGPLMADIFQQSKALLNGVELQIQLTPARPEFTLCSAEDTADYKIILKEASLKICKLTVIPQILITHGEILREHPAVYPYTRTEMKAYHVSEGSFSFNFEDIFQSDVPRRLVIGLLTADCYRGKYSLNPFHFQPFDLTTLGLFVDDESIPSRPLKFDFKHQIFQEGYSSLFDDAGNGPDISRESYAAGYSLISFKLGDNLLPFTGKGNVRLSGIFGDSLKENVVVILYAEFPAVLKIDHARNVLI